MLHVNRCFNILFFLNRKIFIVENLLTNLLTWNKCTYMKNAISLSYHDKSKKLSVFTLHYFLSRGHRSKFIWSCFFTSKSALYTDFELILLWSERKWCPPPKIRQKKISFKSTAEGIIILKQDWKYFQSKSASWAAMSCHELLWAAMHELRWPAMSCHELLWTGMSYHVLLWAAMSCYDLFWPSLSCYKLLLPKITEFLLKFNRAVESKT